MERREGGGGGEGGEGSESAAADGAEMRGVEEEKKLRHFGGEEFVCRNRGGWKGPELKRKEKRKGSSFVHVIRFLDCHRVISLC